MPIVNITATVDFGPQNLAVVSSLPEAWTQKKKVKRVRMKNAFKCARLRKPGTKIVASVYENGKIVILGARHEYQVDDTCNWLSIILKSTQKSAPQIRNIVYSLQLSSAVRLEELYKSLRELPNSRDFGSFNPELSPAFIYRPLAVDGIKALIFRPGKVNITGLKTSADIPVVVEEIQRLVSWNSTTNWFTEQLKHLKTK